MDDVLDLDPRGTLVLRMTSCRSQHAAHPPQCHQFPHSGEVPDELGWVLPEHP